MGWALLGADPLGQLTLPTGDGALALLAVVLVFVGKSIHSASRRAAEERLHLIEQRDHAESIANEARRDADEQRSVALILRAELIQVALSAELGKPVAVGDLMRRLREIEGDNLP